LKPEQAGAPARRAGHLQHRRTLRAECHAQRERGTVPRLAASTFPSVFANSRLEREPAPSCSPSDEIACSRCVCIDEVIEGNPAHILIAAPDRPPVRGERRQSWRGHRPSGQHEPKRMFATRTPQRRRAVAAPVARHVRQKSRPARSVRSTLLAAIAIVAIRTPRAASPGALEAGERVVSSRVPRPGCRDAVFLAATSGRTRSRRQVNPASAPSNPARSIVPRPDPTRSRVRRRGATRTAAAPRVRA